MRRWRKTVLWIGCTSCVLIAVAFVVSAFVLVIIEVPTPIGPSFWLDAGSISFVADRMIGRPLLVESSSFGLRFWNSWSKGEHGIYGVPLYMLFVVVSLPTLYIWRYWPKPPKPGNCRCAHDLRGNVSGTCPECGRETAKI